MNSENLKLLPPDELFEAIGQMLIEGYEAEFTVTGNSMWPLLADKRDCVTLESAENNSLKKGDIVLLRTEQGYLLHRITRFKKGLLQTAGDSNCYYDNYIPQSCVIGRVVKFKRKGKYVSCSNILYRFYSSLWRLLFPVRPFLLRILFLIRRIVL